MPKIDVTKKMSDAKLKWRSFQSQKTIQNIENMYGGEEDGFANAFWNAWPHHIETMCNECFHTRSKTGTVLYFK